jgi:peptidoglycan/xylan/chitin deacetylase (PgdA/CDA1 family)
MGAGMRSFASSVLLAFSLVASVASATLPASPDGDDEPPDVDPMPEAMGHGRIVSGTTAHRTLHFTFDDGPSRRHTERLLDLLDEHHVRATFFLVARQLEHEEERRIARQIAARGHAIGLHSYEHERIDRMEPAALEADLDRSEALFVETFGARPFLFRPPYGHHSDTTDAIVSARGYTQVLWNLHGGDVTGHTPEAVLATFRAMLDRGERDPRGGGGVVLLHDTHPWTVEAFPLLMAELDARNCAALADGEELWDVAPDLSPWHQDLGRASAARSARRMRLSEETWAARQAELRAAAAARCAPSA